VKPIYMDHSATTPVDPEVFYEMKPYFTDSYGNASSVHRFGQNARRAVEKAREQVAKLINASPREIVFTSGGTEADNQAIVSYMTAVQSKGKHIITSAIEHHAVLETCRHLAKQDFDLSVLPVTPEGIVEEEALQAALKPESRLVSIMHANNEIGTVQNIKELAAIAHEAGAVFHTDAVQTLGKIPIDVKAMGIDMLSGSSHKLYGPKGVGCLYIKKGLRVPGLLHGGGQEGKLRAGTENVPAIVGFGKACELAQQNMAKRKEHLEKLSKRLQEGILNTIPNTLLTGHSSQRLPGNVSVCFEFVEGESILLMLDSYGIMASSGSACTSGALDPSHVLMALGLPHEIAHGSLRLTLGKDNTEEDVERVLEVLPGIIANLRRISPISN
jgi:cysteine desulfurase